MRILHLTASSRGLSLTEAEAPRPQPGREDLLIEVHAAGVTPAELSWYPTLHAKSGQPRTGAVPGHEFSGVVVAAGDGVGSLEIGQEVFGMNDWYEEGAMAEYCVAPFAFVAPKPACLTYAEAASTPISSLTAWQGLFDRARLRPGETVLVHGGAGGVGVFVIQLAKLHGAHVIATCSARNVDFVSALGADEVIDYETGRFEDSAPKVDVVFDTVGGETLERSWKLLRESSRLVTIASNGEAANDERMKRAFFIVEPNQKQLYVIGDLLEAKRLRPVIDTVVPLSEASKAYDGPKTQGKRGKVVVEVVA